jgi:hypothetical protein
MASEYFWLLKDRIIYVHLSGTVGEVDLREGNTFISRCLAESNYPVHIQFDCKDVQRITFSVVQIRNELHYLQHPALGWVVIFGMTGVVEHMIEFLSTVVTRLTGLQVYSAETSEEGLAFLRRVDSSLPEDFPSVDVSV